MNRVHIVHTAQYYEGIEYSARVVCKHGSEQGGWGEGGKGEGGGCKHQGLSHVGGGGEM